MPSPNGVIEFRHFACLGKIRAKPHMRGQKIRCPKCGGSTKVPGVSDEVIAAREEAALIRREAFEQKIQRAREASPPCRSCSCDYTEHGVTTRIDTGRAVVVLIVMLFFGSLAWCLLSAAFALFPGGIFLGPIFGGAVMIWLCIAASKRTVYLWVCPQCGAFSERLPVSPSHRIEPRRR